jgi:AcrR family transcriptional regulator
MAAKTTQAEARSPLSRERVLAAAVELADANGIESITMRKVGEALGVEAMSLYNHVANKGDLLDGMVDVVFSEIELPSGDDVGWREAMRVRCASARQVLARHPWAIGLMNSSTSPGAANLGHHDAVLGVLIGAGLSLPLAGHAFAVLDSYTYGFALQEGTIPLAGAEQIADLATEILGVHTADAYPNMAAFTTGYVLHGAYDFADEFDWGLDLVLDGLEWAVAAERKAGRTARTGGRS